MRVFAIINARRLIISTLRFSLLAATLKDKTGLKIAAIAAIAASALRICFEFYRGVRSAYRMRVFCVWFGKYYLLSSIYTYGYVIIQNPFFER